MNGRTGFRFQVEKVFALPGQGIVVTGSVESGSVYVGAEVAYSGTDGKWVKARVIGIEVSRHLVEEVPPGKRASLLLEGVKKDQITVGMILQEAPQTAPASISPSAPRPPSPPEATPPQPPVAKAIHPGSSLWRTLLFILLALLIIWAIFFPDWTP